MDTAQDDPSHADGLGINKVTALREVEAAFRAYERRSSRATLMCSTRSSGTVAWPSSTGKHCAEVEGCPVGLSIVGARNYDEDLLAAASWRRLGREASHLEMTGYMMIER